MTHYCKNCSLMIFPDIRNQEANDRGFCSTVCVRLYEREKEFQIDREERLMKEAQP